MTMKDILSDVVDVWRSGEPSVVATVVDTAGSAPRPVGAAMMITSDGAVAGSVSGGCIESVVHNLSLEVLGGASPKLCRFDSNGHDIFTIGLTCGGDLEVFIEPVSMATFAELDSVADDVREGRPVAVATIIQHPDPGQVARRIIVRPDVVTGSAAVSREVVEGARALLETGESATMSYEGVRVFVASYQSRPRLIVFGSIDFAAAVARQGSLLGFHVTVCDARAVFTTPARFPGADELVVSWPAKYLKTEAEAGRVDNRTAICVLTHDQRFDVPILEVALGLQDSHAPAFIGAMGSLRTHADREARLKDAGVGPQELAKLSSPIGLDLGGRTPEETALSVMAEIIALRHGGTGRRLTGSSRPIHQFA